MQYDENAEKSLGRRKMKCDHIRTREQGDTPFFPNMLNNGKVEICLKEDVDAAIAELKDKCQMHDFFWEGCGFKKLGFKNSIDVRDYCDELKRQNEDLIPKCRKAYKELRHNKHKRCLAMARWCEMCHKELLTRACLPTKQNWNRHDEWRYFVDFWHRYEYRFRKLAEKFKEAK